MWADVLRQAPKDDPTTTSDNGHWVMQQDQHTGAIKRQWIAYDDPNTDIDEATAGESFPCIARGIIAAGIRSQGTTEDFSNLYKATDVVQLRFPPDVVLSRRDRVTNIRDRYGNIIWKEEESDDSPATVFNVQGVVPIVDAFNNHTGNFTLLERAERQANVS